MDRIDANLRKDAALAALYRSSELCVGDLVLVHKRCPVCHYDRRYPGSQTCAFCGCGGRVMGLDEDYHSDADGGL